MTEAGPGLAGDLVVLAQVLAIDLMLAGDNAIIIGLAVARLPEAQRRRAILIGIGAATAIRIAFALVALKLLAIIGLTLAGGLLLLYVTWKMFRELRHPPASEETGPAPPGRMWDAAVKIILADISMSLDNVLAVAGAARDSPVLLAIGLVVSIALMAVAAEFVARLLHRHRWVVWIGLVIVLYVSLDMIHAGIVNVSLHLGITLPGWFV